MGNVDLIIALIQTLPSDHVVEIIKEITPLVYKDILSVSKVYLEYNMKLKHISRCFLTR